MHTLKTIVTTIDYKFLVVMTILLSYNCSYNENHKISKHKKENSINELLNLADEWEKSNIDSAYYYSERALKESELNNSRVGKIQSLNNLGFALLEMGKEKEAYEKHTEALSIAEEESDSSEISKTLNFIGRYYNSFSDYDIALNYFLRSHKIRIQLKDTIGIGVTAANIGMDYFRLKQYDLAEKYLLQSKEIDSIQQDTFYLAGSYLNLALVYKDTGRLKKALQYDSKALTASQSIDDLEGVCLAYGNIGMVYLEMEDFYKAKAYLDKSNAIRQKMNRPYYHLWGQIMYMDLFHNWKQHERSLKHADTALSYIKAVPNKRLEERIYKSKASSYSQLGNYRLALQNKQLQEVVKDSLNSETRTQNIASTQVKLNVLEKENQLLKKESEITLLSAKNKLKNLWIIFGSLALIALFSIIILWRSRRFSQKKVQLQETFAQDLIRNVETERKRISSELHDSVGQSLLLIKNKVFLNNDQNQDTKIIDDTIDEVRSISQSLHPFQFEKLGLIASIKNTVETFQKNSDIFYSEDIDEEHLNISKDKEIFVFRMIQECLNNVEKHSQAKACNILVEDSNDSVLFQVKDNGIGFDVSENSEILNSLGLKTLKERAQIIGAQLSINSTKGKGTTVQIKVPKP